MNQNLRKIPVFIILVVILYGCGNAESTVSETTTNSIVENSQTIVSDNISEDSQQPDIDNLIEKSTSITLFYGYSMEDSSGTGPVYSLHLNDNSTCTFRANVSAKDGSLDYTGDKYKELQNLLLDSNPSSYDLNEHTDEDGRIIYEILNPSVQINSNGETFYLDVDDTTPIESFFDALCESNNLGGIIETKSNDETLINSNNITPSTTEELDLGKEITLSSTVNIRSDMNSSSSKVAVAYAGEKVYIIETTGEWTKVLYNEKQGYVRTDLLKEI